MNGRQNFGAISPLESPEFSLRVDFFEFSNKAIMDTTSDDGGDALLQANMILNGLLGYRNENGVAAVVFLFGFGFRIFYRKDNITTIMEMKLKVASFDSSFPHDFARLHANFLFRNFMQL